MESNYLLDDLLKIAYLVLGLLALFEWLILGSFLASVYINVARRPEKHTSITLAVIHTVFFVAVRSIFILFFVLAMPNDIVPGFFIDAQRASMYILAAWWVLIIAVPALRATIAWAIRGLGNKRLDTSDIKMMPLIKCILPVYNEDPKMLRSCIQSILGMAYPAELIELHVAFDSDEDDDLSRGAIEYLKSLTVAAKESGEVEADTKPISPGSTTSLAGGGVTNVGPHSIVMTLVTGSVVYVHRFPHGGKKHTQGNTWAFIRSMEKEQLAIEVTTSVESPEFKSAASVNDDVSASASASATSTDETATPNKRPCMVVFTDSDNYILDNAFNNLARAFHDNPKKVAYAGYMSCKSKPEKWYQANMIRMIQDTEYVSSEMNRVFEDSIGAINCMPGCFTGIRYEVLKDLEDKYFIDLPPNATITQYHQRTLGEDRYLTHLIHVYYPRNSIGFCPHARCNTDPPDTGILYIKQRRRWLLGSVSNEGYMLCNTKLWLKFPVFLTFKTMQAGWRATTFSQLLVVVFAISQLTLSSENQLAVFLMSTLIPIGAAWLCAVLAGVALKRYKVCFLWPFMIIAQTLLQPAIDGYAIWTWRQRSWGGPRVATGDAVVEDDGDGDAGASADAAVSPRWAETATSPRWAETATSPRWVESSTSPEMCAVVNVPADAKAADK